MKFMLTFHNRAGRRTEVEGETTEDGLFFRAMVESALDMITKFTTLHASITWGSK